MSCLFLLLTAVAAVSIIADRHDHWRPQYVEKVFWIGAAITFFTVGIGFVNIHVSEAAAFYSILVCMDSKMFCTRGCFLQDGQN